MASPKQRFFLNPFRFANRSLWGLILLILLGYLGNYFHWSLFFNIDFLFGSITVWLVVCLYGTAWGTIAGLIVGSCTYILWNHPYAIITFTVEALFVGWLFHRRQQSIVLLDAVFWVVIGTPWIWLAYSVLLHVDPTQTRFVLLKQAVNGIFNALIASHLLTYLPLHRWVNRPPASNQFPLQQTLFNLLTAFVFLPTLVLILLASHRVVQSIQTDAKTALNATSRYLVAETRAWYQQHWQTVADLAQWAEASPEDRLPQQLNSDEQVLTHFQAFYLLRSDGTVIQTITPTPQSAQLIAPALLTQLSRTFKPNQTSIVVPSPNGRSPLLFFRATLQVKGQPCFLLGLTNLRTLEALFPTNIEGQHIEATLVDSNKTVIASNQTQQSGLERFDWRQNGEVKVLATDTYHWFPTNSISLVMARWTKSFFVQEVLLDRTNGWQLIIEIPAQPRIDYAQQVYIQNLALLLFVGGLALILANWVSRQFVKPLTQLATVTTNLPNKLLEREAIAWAYSPITEVALLTRNFQMMATSLKQKFGEIQQVNETLEQRVQERTHALLQANAALKTSEEKYRKLMETANDAIFVADGETGVIVDANLKATELVGRPLIEIIGLHQSQLHPPEERERYSQQFLQDYQAGGCLREEIECIHTNGKRIPVEATAGLFEIEGRRYMQGIFRDVSDRKRAEAALRQSQEQLQLALEASQMGIWDWNLHTNQIIWSARNEQLLGFAPGTFDGSYDTFEACIHPDDRAAVAQAATCTRQTRQDFHQEFRVIWADGSIHWLEGRGRLFYDLAGVPMRMVGTTVDISDRKQAEERLRRSEANLLAAQQVAHIGNWEFVLSTQTLTLSEEIFRICGLDPHQPQPSYETLLQMHHSDDASRLQQAINQAIATGEPYDLDLRFFLPDGSLRYLNSRGQAVCDLEAQAVRLFGTTQDVTDRVQAEIALRQSEAHNRALLHAIPDLIIRMSGTGVILEYKPPMGFKAYISHEACGKSVYEVLPFAIAQERMMYIQQALQTGTPQVYELQLVIEGEVRTHEARIVISGEDEVLAIVRDITDRKQAELALQESRDLFGATFNESTDAIFLVDTETSLIFDCNERALELFEATCKADLVGQRGETFYRTPLSAEKFEALIQEFKQNGLWSGEIEYSTLKGNSFWGSISIKSFSIANKPLTMVRITDISQQQAALQERKQAEKALQISEARNQALINAIPDLMIRMARDGQYLDFRAAKGFKTYKPYENVGSRSIFDALPSDVAQERMRYVEQALQTGETQIYEFQIPVKGQLRSEEARIVVSGENEVLVIVRDITEQKHTEQLIRARNQELATLHKISEIILSSQSLRAAFQAIATEISTTTEFPCVAIELYNATRQVMIFEGMKGIPLPPDCDVLEVPVSHTLSGLVATTGQPMVRHFGSQGLKLCTANESLNQLNIKTFICMPMIVNQGTIGVLSLAHPEAIQPDDNFLRLVSSLANYLALVSDRKQAEASLRESEERLKLALEATQMGIWELNPSELQATWSESCEELYGLASGSFEGTHSAFLQQVHPDDREWVRRNVAQAIQEQTGLNHEFRIIHPDGSVHWVLERGQVFCDEKGQAIRLLGIAMDITERKQFEAFLQQTNAELDIQVAERTTELKEAIAQLQTEIIKRKQTQEELRRTLVTNQALLNAIPDLILRIRRDGTYLDCIPTKALDTILTPSEQIGKKLQDVLPDNLAQQRFYHIEQAFRTGVTQMYEYQIFIDGGLRDEEARIVVSGEDEVVVLIRDITDRKQAERALQVAHEELTGWVNDLERRHQEITLLNQMSDLLQACLNREESCRVLMQLLPRLFPENAGTVFLIGDSQNSVEAIATWGVPTSQSLFAPHECFALRRGQPHFVEETNLGLCCYHLLTPLPKSYFCVPMVAKGKAIGVLYLNTTTKEPLLPVQRQLAITVAQQIALAMANLKLYETLQTQSIRDPLTGLFNRRYLEESLARELHRAQRSQQPLSLIVIDVDHFKRFNDTFGHDGGDAVLRGLGQFLQNNVRGSDVACRFGGEELVLILPGATPENACQRAEELRQGAKQLAIKHSQPLGAITISLGVACFPLHGSSGESLLKAADEALYRAKAEGRDRVILAS